MADKSLVWVWAAGAVACAVYGFAEKNYIWFASAALCAWNTWRWYKRYLRKGELPMVKHIVVYTLKEGVDKDEAVKLIASQLEPLVGKIPGLLKMEVRRCFSGMDYALYSEFEKAEDVPAYRAHPLHQEAKKHFHHLLDQRYSADYEV